MSSPTRAEFDALYATVADLQHTVHSLSVGVYRAAAAQMQQVHSFVGSPTAAWAAAPPPKPRVKRDAPKHFQDFDAVPKKRRSEVAHRCGKCGGTGHNARTCGAPDAPLSSEDGCGGAPGVEEEQLLLADAPPFEEEAAAPFEFEFEPEPESLPPPGDAEEAAFGDAEEEPASA